MHIGVTGGTGFIGSRLVEFLTAAGHKTECLIRSTSSLRWVAHTGAGFVEGDLDDKDSLRPFVRGKDLIFHVAGRIKGTAGELFSTNSRGTENLLAAAAARNPDLRRFLFVSTQEVLGIVDGREPAAEDTPARPVTAYGKSKREAEQIVMGYDGKVPWTIIRPSTVFGPRDPELLLFFNLVSKGWVLSPKVDAKISVLYSGNFIPALYAAATSRVSTGKIYHLADDETVTWKTFGEIIAASMGEKTRRLIVPKWVLRLIGAANSLYSTITKKPATLNKEKLLMMMQPNLEISNRRAKEDFGFHSTIPLAQGIRETVAWYREEGWLR